ncbi:MAG: glycosyltransferase family 4 protein, partial [Paracoccaceae bacterium]|nr:glycosyltransferase family 4 protein [Paracoccaceae bacterium]
MQSKIGIPSMRSPAPAAALALPGDITTLTGGYIYDRLLLEELRAAGRDVQLLQLPDGFPFPTSHAMSEALSALQALPADCPVIIDGLAFGALTPIEVARIRAPIVALVHHPLALESGLPEDMRRHLWQTERENLRHAAQVLVPSPHTRAILIEQYDVPADRIHIALPGVAQPLPASAAPVADKEPPLIISVGILHPRKGHDVLIDALARIADLDWRAEIVGNPWEEGHSAALQARIDTTGLEGRIRLAGRVSAEELDQLYRHAAIFALATRYEGYGIVFNEALVHGLPIVSCRTGAVPDTVPSDAGLLVEPDDPEAFSAALRALLSDSDRRGTMAVAARHRGAALASWSET